LQIVLSLMQVPNKSTTYVFTFFVACGALINLVSSYGRELYMRRVSQSLVCGSCCALVALLLRVVCCVC
jgi:hypothetical protein